jgi:hypothetical protein
MPGCHLHVTRKTSWTETGLTVAGALTSPCCLYSVLYSQQRCATPPNHLTRVLLPLSSGWDSQPEINATARHLWLVDLETRVRRRGMISDRPGAAVHVLHTHGRHVAGGPCVEYTTGRVSSIVSTATQQGRFLSVGTLTFGSIRNALQMCAWTLFSYVNGSRVHLLEFAKFYMANLVICQLSKLYDK